MRFFCFSLPIPVLFHLVAKFYDIVTRKEFKNFRLEGPALSAAITAQPAQGLSAVVVSQKTHPVSIKFFAYNEAETDILSAGAQLRADVPEYADSLMLTQDTEHLFVLSSELLQIHVGSSEVTRVGAIQPAYNSRRAFSSSGSVVVVPNGSDISFFRVPSAAGQTPTSVPAGETVEKCSFSNDGSFVAASTVSGTVKIFALVSGDPNPPLTRLNLSSIPRGSSSHPRALPTVPTIDATPLPVLPQILSKVVSTIKLAAGSLLQIHSHRAKDDHMSLYALGNTGVLIRLMEPPNPTPSSALSAHKLEDFQSADERKRPFSFFVTSTSSYVCLTSPSGVFLYRTQREAPIFQVVGKYLEPLYTIPEDHRKNTTKISTLDAHPSDNNFLAIATTDGQIMLKKPPSTQWAPKDQAKITAVRFAQLPDGNTSVCWLSGVNLSVRPSFCAYALNSRVSFIFRVDHSRDHPHGTHKAAYSRSLLLACRPDSYCYQRRQEGRWRYWNGY